MVKMEQDMMPNGKRLSYLNLFFTIMKLLTVSPLT